MSVGWPIPFSMAVKNVELMHECCSQQMRMGTSRMKWDKETAEDRERK